MRWQTNISNGICNLSFDRPDIEMNKLVLTTLEGRCSLACSAPLPSPGFDRDARTMGAIFLVVRCHWSARGATFALAATQF